MCERVTRELAFPSNGQPFDVTVIRKEGTPPTIVCDGDGQDCPFKGRFHLAQTCVLGIDSNPGVNLCGVVGPSGSNDEETENP